MKPVQGPSHLDIHQRARLEHLEQEHRGARIVIWYLLVASVAAVVTIAYQRDQIDTMRAVHGSECTDVIRRAMVFDWGSRNMWRMTACGFRITLTVDDR